ncbi:MAG: AAA family ATPase [Roseburia sp.]|nr:AAA family ATPase [Roseburia sp.]
MLTLQIPTKPYEDEKIYSKKEHAFNEGMTILVGQNGAGKSTLLRFLNEKCHKEKLPFFYYDNYAEGGSTALSKYGFYGDTTALATGWCSSEGQQIYMNFSYMMQSLGNFVRKHKGTKQIVLAFDAIDSGLDLANIAEIKDFLLSVIDDIRKNGTEVYVLISANSYGFVKGSRCYDVARNKEIIFNSYEEYEKFIFGRVKERNGKSKTDN